MNENNKLTREETIQIISGIKDQDVRNFIFGADQDDNNFLRQKESFYKYFNNILILSFMYIYCKFLKWKETKGTDIITNEILRKSSNFMRIITTLDKLYYEFNLTYEVIENLLSDVQILLVTENSPVFTKELGIENSFTATTKFSTFTHLAKIGRYGTGRTSELDNETSLGERRKELVEFLRTVPFIENLDIESKSSKGIEFDNIDEQMKPFERLEVSTNSYFKIEEIDPNFAFLYNKKTNEYYYLESVAQRKDRLNGTEYLILCYLQTGKFVEGNQQYVIVKNIEDNVDVDIEDVVIISEESGIEGFKRKIFPSISDVTNSPFIKDFNSINFRYVRVLSLAISDILQEDGRKFIYKMYSKKPEYSAMFNEKATKDDYLRNNNEEETGYGWDVVIATLLIEESATKLLTALFNDRETRFEQLLTNISYRFGQKIDSINLRQKVQQYVAEEKAEINSKTYGSKYGINFVSSNIEEENKITAKIQAQVLIAKLSELTESNETSDYRTKFPLSMKSRIKIVKEIAEVEAGSFINGYKEKVKALKIIVSQTIKTLYCFYKGLFAYANEKLKFERDSILRPLKLWNIEESQRHSNELFDEEIAKHAPKMRAIGNYDVKTIMQEMKKFCKQCSFPGKQGSYNELLKRMLGRDFLLNYNEIAMLETCFDKEVISRRDFKDLVEQINDAFYYLMNGIPDGERESDGVIFPYVAYLDYVSKTRDGYEIIHFSTTMDSDHESDVKVISEYHYKPSKSYYCVPNKSRSNEELKLWIEPIIINYEHVCQDFMTMDEED